MMSVFSVWDATLEKCHQLQNCHPTCHNPTWSMVNLTTEWKSWRAKSSWKCWQSAYTVLFMVWKPKYQKQLQYSTRSPSISWLVAIVQMSLSPHTLSIPYKDGVQKSLVAVARAQQPECVTALLLILFPPNENFAFLFHLILLQFIHLETGSWQEGVNQDVLQLCPDVPGGGCSYLTGL